MKRNKIIAGVVFNLIGQLFTSTLNATPQPSVEPGKAFGKVPLSFEANVGQTDPQVKYLARGNGYTAFFTPKETVLKLTRKTTSVNSGAGPSPALTERPQMAPRVDGNVASAVVRIQPVDASPDMRLEASGPIASRITYLTGPSGSKAAQAPSFEKIAYEGAWPGISMMYRANQRQLEYDFVVAPGAKTSSVRLAFEGIENVRIDENGVLVITTSAGELRQPAPTVYQEIDGKRVTIAGGYTLAASQVGFQIGEYDPSRALVIDPTLVFADSWGGSGEDYAQAVAVNPHTGVIYVAGYTASPDFPVTTGYAPGGANAFVSAISPDGASLIFSIYIGGSFDDGASGIALDNAGNIYVTGWTQSSDFPETGHVRISCGLPCQTGTYSYPVQIAVDFFIVELNAAGQVTYSQRFGGSADDYANAIAVDNYGLVYVTGRTYSWDFPVLTNRVDGATGQTTQNHLSGQLNGQSDAFLFVFSTQNGGAVLTSSFLGGAGDESAKSIAVINLPISGAARYTETQIFIGGWTSSYNFGVTSGASQSAYQGGNADGFVVRIDVIFTNSFAIQFQRTDYVLGYGTYIGGENEDVIYGIAVDASGILHATGYTRSQYFPTSYNCFQRYYGGGNSDAFVVKLGTTGAIQYATYFGGSGDDIGRAIVVDNHDRAYFTGYTNSYDMPLTYGAFQYGNAGGWDAFAAELINDGTYLQYASYFGGWNDEFAYAMAWDGYGNLFVAGSTNSNIYGDTDAMLLKLNVN